MWIKLWRLKLLCLALLVLIGMLTLTTNVMAIFKSSSHLPVVITRSVRPVGRSEEPKVTTRRSPPAPSLPACPAVPRNLRGFNNTKAEEKALSVLERRWGRLLKMGGTYRPPDCLPRDLTAIIIPCRNRWGHLRLLLDHLIPFLIRQQLSFTLFVMESEQEGHFNKAMLLNAGYLEALKLDNYTCFIFQDADKLPLNDNNLYRCGSQPRHLAVALDKNKFRLRYKRYIGGAVAFTREQFETVNGFSNAYFGWGKEDDDMAIRLETKGFKIDRMAENQAQYHSIPHDRDRGNEKTRQNFIIGAEDEVVKRIDQDGVRQVLYHKDSTQLCPLFTWIKICINQTQVIENLPPNVRERFKHGLNFMAG